MGDLHITGKNPICRTDDILETTFGKIEQIISLANYYNTPIIQVGDIFNVAIVANSIMSRLGSILGRLNNPLYFVWGNHDLLYHAMEVWHRTSLGVLWKNNDRVKHISEFPLKFDWLDYDNSLIRRTGSKFLLTHKSVMLESMIGKGSWIEKDKSFGFVINNEKQLHRYKLIICGHWHTQYIFNYKGTKVVNPGPVVRQSLTEKEIGPKVVLIDLDSPESLTKDIYLDVQPMEKVFTEEHMNKKIHTVKNSVSDYVQKIKDKIENKKSIPNFMKRLMHLLDSHELPKSTEKTMRNLISKTLEKKGE